MSYDMKIIDGAISDELRQRVWTYLINSKWGTMWKPIGLKQHVTYTPAIDTEYAYYRAMTRSTLNTLQHRAAFASDDASLKAHPVLDELWQQINGLFDNQFTITGHPEGLPVDANDPQWQPPPTQDPTLMQGWRVYANGQTDESSKRTHGVHRDSPFVNEDKNWTILFCANPEWYPTWYGDCVYYPDDPEGKTGDHQQYQNMHGHQNQNRNFKIGWPEKIVSPVPGRIIAYDGRWLHTTHPTSIWCQIQRRVVAFRVRKP